MSLGYGGGCRKISEDADFVLDEYFSYNLSFEDRKKIFDGLILIKKSALLEPERREKFRRMPSGKRRKFVKIILREVPLYELIDSGDVQIENCSHAWSFLPNGIDRMAYRMCRKIFEYYQLEGTLPDKSSWFV
ncbi:MAG: hypothetical protein II857_09075 [Selenomonadaceae bacterium]|nr:hypothetical protein [Selenomonadaceae bacterium]